MESKVSSILERLKAAIKRADAFSDDWKQEYRRFKQGEIIRPAKAEALDALKALESQLRAELDPYEQAIDDSMKLDPASDLERLHQEIIKSEIRNRFANWINTIDRIEGGMELRTSSRMPEVDSAWLKQVRDGDKLAFQAVAESRIPLFGQHTMQAGYHQARASMATDAIAALEQAKDDLRIRRRPVTEARREVKKLTSTYGV